MDRTADNKLGRWVKKLIQSNRVRRAEDTGSETTSLEEDRSTLGSSLYVNNPRHGYSLDVFSDESSSHTSAKTAKTARSLFEVAAEAPPTPETSVASASVHNNHYTHHPHYPRSLATTAHNDSASVITLASSSRNILGRSKSARRSVETFNSSTIGIPPSSILERLAAVVDERGGEVDCQSLSGSWSEASINTRS